MDLNFSEVIPQLEVIVKDIMQNEVGEMAKESQKRNKQREVYDAYVPNQYNRTYGFLNANDIVMESRSLKNNIYMYVYTPTSAEWMSDHESWVDGTRQAKNIPYWIQNSNSPSSIFIYNARDYITPTRSEIESKLKSAFIKGFRGHGITAT